MKTFLHVLSIVYWLCVPPVILFALFGAQLIAIGKGSQDYVFLVINLFVVLFLIFGALESGKDKKQRSFLEYILIFGPAVTIVGFLGYIFL